MPIAVPTMPDSLIGVSKQRSWPYFCCRPAVTRKTPPKYPTSSPNTTTRSSRLIDTSSASRSASIIVIRAMSEPGLLPLTAQMRRHRLVDALEHVARGRTAAGVQRAVALGLALRGDHLREHLLLELAVPLLGPCAAQDQVVLQADHRIAERPGVGLGLRTIGGRIVRRGMRADAIRDVLDQGRAEIRAGAVDRPFRDRVDGEIVVAVDAQRRDAEAESARGEGARAAARDALESGDRPLVVDDVQHDRRAVRRREDERGVEVGFGGGAVADP